MIHYHHFTLDNGLQVYVHEDASTSTAVLNILYNVGSRDEEEDKTGFAHLFEHLMFGGSQNIPSFDTPLQLVGGENNAFTTPDITNYYIILPAVNIETAFWLESDRMLSLSFDENVLEIQRNVVIEEFKQRYLNQPYGDAWLKIRPLAYTTHPYKWATIGKDISHIEKATIEDVKNFFYKYYIPNNAILVIAGNVNVEQIKKLSEKWFGPIPARKPVQRQLPVEPIQNKPRKETVQAHVPVHALYKAYHMCGKKDLNYHATELACDLLGRDKSSILYQSLVKDKKIFSSLHSYITGSIDPGLLLVEGKLSPGYTLEQADEEVQKVLNDFIHNAPEENELTKVKNQTEATIEFGKVELLERAMAIAFGANLGDADRVNKEIQKIQAVTTEDIQKVSAEILKEENCSTLYYKANI